MNRIWLLCISGGILFAFFHQDGEVINEVVLQVGKDTFDFVVPLLCVTCFWNGVLNVAKDAGFLKVMKRIFHPVLRRLLPDVKNGQALGYIATNIVVNMFGLGSAATPAGLQAMKLLQEENPDKINKDFLLNTMEKYKNTSLYVLADPPVFKQAKEVSGKEIQHLISVLKETFSYIVVDTDANFDGKTITALDNSDLLFLVTIVNLPALRNCQRCLDLFEKLGYDNDKVQILINRYMENDEIKAEDVEKLLNKQVYWKIPNNYFTLMAAINKGVLVSEINSTSNVAVSFRELAMNISDSIYRKKLINKYSNNSVSNIYNILRG